MFRSTPQNDELGDWRAVRLEDLDELRGDLVGERVQLLPLVEDRIDGDPERSNLCPDVEEADVGDADPTVVGRFDETEVDVVLVVEAGPPDDVGPGQQPLRLVEADGGRGDPGGVRQPGLLGGVPIRSPPEMSDVGRFRADFAVS